MILAGFFVCGPFGKDGCMGGSSDGLFLFLQGFGAFFVSFSTHAKKRRPVGRPRSLTNPFGEVWRARRPSKVNSYRPAFPGRSIFAAGASRAHRSFRSPPSGRFATFGGKCPQGTRFPPVPQALCRSTKSKRCEHPKGARNAAVRTPKLLTTPAGPQGAREALRAAKGRKQRVSPHQHLFSPPSPEPPALPLFFLPLRQGLPSRAPKPATKSHQQRSQSP